MLKKIPCEDTAPWKQRFRAPRILWTEIAKKAPLRGLAACNLQGVYQLYAWDVLTGTLTPITNKEEGIIFGMISPDGNHVYYLNDEQGNEKGHYVRIPFEGGNLEDITPDIPLYASWDFVINLANTFISCILVTPDGFHLFTIDISQNIGTPKLLYKSKKIMMKPCLSSRGNTCVIASTERMGMQHYSLMAFDTVTGELINELWKSGSSLMPVAFSPVENDYQLLAATNETGSKRPFIWNPSTGECTHFELDLKGEITPLDWSFEGDSILLCQVHHAVQTLYIYQVEEDMLKQVNAPGGTYGFLENYGMYFGPDKIVYMQWQDSTHPPQLLSLDQRGNSSLVLKAGDVPQGHPWKSVTFVSDQQIQGWLGLPEGKGPFPAIVHVHGGPDAVAMETFSPESQTFLDCGFAYLTINYSGSTTFSRKFQESIWGNPGFREVRDMAAARTWLIQKGIAHPDQVFASGWSYGGYLALLALGTYPRLWAGGMAGTAVADWISQYNYAAETLKGYITALFGGTPEEKTEQYRFYSPITYADKVTAPVLIIQGRNDTRTPYQSIELYEEKMKALKKSIEVHWFDAGHFSSSAQTELSIKHQEIMLHFVNSVLSSDYQ